MKEERYYQNSYEEEYIDPIALLKQMVKWGKKYLVMGIILMIVGTAIGGVFSCISTYNTYKAYATFTVKGSVTQDQSTNDMNLSNQIGLTFTYMISSGVLTDIIEEELGLEEVEAIIEASSISNTNMVTITVTDNNAVQAYEILEVIINNYSEVMEYVIGATELTVVDESGVPQEPVLSIRSLIIYGGVGCVAGVVLYVAFLFFYAIGRKTVKTSSDIMDICDVRCLVSAPEFAKKKHTDKELLIHKNTVSQPFKESIKLLANKIEFSKRAENNNVFAVTSLLKGEGKTTISTNLVIALSQKRKKVLFIDADMHKPSVAKLLGIPANTIDLLSVLKGESTYKQAIRRGKNNELDVLPAFVHEEDVEYSELLGSDAMKRLINQVKSEYDYVIIDTPPVELFADTSDIAHFVDGVIITVKQDYALLDDVTEMMNNFMDTDVNIEGFVLNGSHVEESNYGYGYGYKYGYYEKYGYGDKYQEL